MNAMATTPTELPPIIESPELADVLKEGRDLRLIDVRTPAEYASVHIPGSYNVPLDQLAEHRAELAALDVPVVLICRSGSRARQAEALVREVDLSPLHVLAGGVSAWEQAGLALRRGGTAWSIERQVRAIAGALVVLGTLGGLLIWQPLIYLALLVGAGLLFAGLTDACMMGMLLAKLPFNRAASCDVKAVVDELVGARAGA
jgi:rhodanese-related sulfurtransferase